ncbi:unnamed protein product [Soboliphyme baturini]|uniref:Secreted protein n=1 Tax=Soboliphyme baturini TaxID=241478 RepID=A0A183J6M1_9BILA|nr:unnamed protein product [Soboliphyme baturini]
MIISILTAVLLILSEVFIRNAVAKEDQFCHHQDGSCIDDFSESKSVADKEQNVIENYTSSVFLEKSAIRIYSSFSDSRRRCNTMMKTADEDQQNDDEDASQQLSRHPF